MNYIMKLFILLSFVFLFSCINKHEETKEMYVFLRNTPQFPQRHGVMNLLIENNKFYTNENLYVVGENKLLCRNLGIEEKESLAKILENIDYNKLKHRFVENEYDAKFEYDIYLDYKQNKINIKIFQDTVPAQCNLLITYLEKLKDTGEYDTLKSKIEGINDANIALPINDTVSSSFKQMFCLWKYLMCYDGVIDTISFCNIDFYKTYDYTFSYGLDYIGKRLVKLIIKENKVILIYDTGQGVKINKPIVFE